MKYHKYSAKRYIIRANFNALSFIYLIIKLKMN